MVTLPLELEMNGVPHMVVMRSISLYGLSDLILTFEDSTNDYFARQIVFERLAQAAADRRNSGPRALVQPQWPSVSLCAGKSRPQPAGTENH